MVVDKISNPKKSSTKARRITRLADYIFAPSATNGREKCVFSMALGFVCDDFSSQKKEMISLSSLSKRSKDTVNHYVMSFQAGEHPTEEQFDEMVKIFAERMGWKDHQMFAALHTDTDNHHVHIAINRVHPETEKVVEVNQGKDIELAMQAIALIEHKQGWRREKNGLYHVLENGEVARNTSQGKKKTPGSKQREMELKTGEKSAQRIGHERATDILRDAKSWHDVHEKMQQEGFRYEKFGSGAKIFIGAIAIKASEIENGSMGKMEKRLGPFEPFVIPQAFIGHKILETPATERIEIPPSKKISDSKVILESATSWGELHKLMGEKGFRFEKTGSGSTVFLGDTGLKSSEISRKGSLQQLQKRLGEYQSKENHAKFFEHTAEPDSGYFRNTAGHGLQKLSERRLAYTADERIAGVLQIDARVDRSKLESVRRQSKPALDIKGKYIREPFKNDTEAWKEYSDARHTHKSIRKIALGAADAASRDEIIKLRLDQKMRRAEYLTSNWNGRGLAFKALKSVLAARQAAEKNVLLNRHRSRKEFLIMEHPAEFPTFEQWQSTRGRPDLARKGRENRQEVQDILGDVDVAPKRRDLRDFSHRVDGEAVAYYKQDDSGSSAPEIGFVDHGRKIRVHDWRDEETTLAALQLASQKFGKFAVNGGDEYKKMCIRLAAEHGFKITNPELQDALAQEKIRLIRERQSAASTKEFQDFEKYHAAVGADRYRITARKEVAGAKDKLFLIGDGGAPLKGVVPDRVAMKIGEMIHLAKQGQKIELGPLSKNMHHFVVKGVSDENLKRLQRDGYNPSVIVRTGPGMHTAIINMKKLVEYDDAHKAIHGEKIGTLLSKMYGSGQGGLSHSAPGFLQSEIIKAVKTECTKIVELARKVVEDIEDRRAGKAPVPVKTDPLDVLSVPDSPSSRMMIKPTAPRLAAPKI